MNPLRLSLYSSVLCCLPALASADEAPRDWAQRRVEAGLLRPLVQQEDGRSRFSRVRQPPRERRVRVTDERERADRTNKTFLTFAIDVRFGDGWKQDDWVGCVYRDGGEIFVKVGESYRPAAWLLGKDVAEVAGVCETTAKS